jgi:endonuclease YncB( thermonuclease family)
VGLIVAALFAAFILIGIFAPASDEAEPTDQPADQSQDVADPTTTEEHSEEAETTTEEEPPPPPPRVARVIDGDTLELTTGDRIRLVQLDAPERNGECYARQATNTLRRLLPAGTRVRVARDRRLDNRDRFGRLLRYVHKGDQNINVLLVRRGAASVWFFRGDRGRHAGELSRAADRARAQGRGAWGACDASYDFLAAWTTRRKPPPPAPVVTPEEPVSPDCHPSYKGACLDPFASDYDCAGGEGDGPEYTGFVRVVGPDDFELDRDGDGLACEAS